MSDELKQLQPSYGASASQQLPRSPGRLAVQVKMDSVKRNILLPPTDWVSSGGNISLESARGKRR